MNGVTKTRLILAVLASCLMTSAAGAAILVVVEARGVPLKPGATVDAAKPLTLKQGQHVTLVSEKGTTIKLDGPYDKPPVAAGGGGGTDLKQTMAALVIQRQARSGEFGVTRGNTLAALPDPWLVDATHSGNVCMMQNTMPVFWRPNAAAPASLVVAPQDQSWIARAKWPLGHDRVTVTTDVPMHPGETYDVTLNGNESSITLIEVPASLTNRDMQAGWMADRRCEQQAEALQRTDGK